jgi:hypothetical protein
MQYAEISLLMVNVVWTLLQLRPQPQEQDAFQCCSPVTHVTQGVEPVAGR